MVQLQNDKDFDGLQPMQQIEDPMWHPIDKRGASFVIVDVIAILEVKV